MPGRIRGPKNKTGHLIIRSDTHITGTTKEVKPKLTDEQKEIKTAIVSDAGIGRPRARASFGSKVEGIIRSIAEAGKIFGRREVEEVLNQDKPYIPPESQYINVQDDQQTMETPFIIENNDNFVADKPEPSSIGSGLLDDKTKIQTGEQPVEGVPPGVLDPIDSQDDGFVQ